MVIERAQLVPESPHMAGEVPHMVPEVLHIVLQLQKQYFVRNGTRAAPVQFRQSDMHEWWCMHRHGHSQYGQAFTVGLLIEKCICCCRNAMLFMETSARTAANTSELFELIAQKISASHGSNATPEQSVPPAKSTGVA